MATTKKVAKVRKVGIRLLADDLVANKKKYDQNTFGDVEDCGTVACLAGLCHMREIGVRKFNKLARYGEVDSFACITSGERQLGITNAKTIFNTISAWPSDLKDEYYENGPLGRVVVALKALQRLKPDGSIDRMRAAVHTRLPQLTKLLKEQAALKAKAAAKAKK